MPWYDYHMFGWLSFFGFGMMILWLIIIFEIIYFLYRLASRGAIPGSAKTAENILAERHAKGELTRDEYLRMREDIREPSENR